MNKRLSQLAAVLLLTGLTAAACSTPQRDLPDGLYAEIVTNRGDIVIRLEPEKAPLTTMNFVGLAEGTIDNEHAPGEPFFNGLTFHRVEPGFVIQGGDPDGNGTGGPGYEFPNEIHPDLRHDKPGVVAMANSGPDTNGSQFYITMRAVPHLDGGYSVFGEVVEGMDVVESIEVGDGMREVNILRYGEGVSGYDASTEAFEALKREELAEREAERVRTQEQALERVRERWPGITELNETGILLAEVTPGSGAPPEQGDRVELHIVFTLLDGTQLDSTRDRGEPQSIVYLRDRLIRGLEIAVGTLGVGRRVIAVVPPELAFGSSGMPPEVPADSFVIFDVERLR